MDYSNEQVKKLEEENQRLKRFIDTSSRKVLREMFDSHQAVMLLINAFTGQIEDANNAAVSFYKYPKEKLLKLKIEDINTLSSDEIKNNRMKILKGEKKHFIFPHRLADGTIRQVEVYSSRYELNKKPVLFSIIHDITDRINAEEEQRKNEEKFISIFRSNPNSMIISNLDDGKVYDVNDAFLELSGLSREDIIGKSTLSIDLYENPDDRDKMVQILREKASVRNLEMKLRNSTGDLLNVLISSEVLRTRSDKTIITTIINITKRVELKEQLESNITLLQAIFDSVPAMITVYDPTLQKIDANREFERITGWTQEDIQEKNIMELVYPDPKHRQMAAEFMQSLQPGFKDFIMTGKNGSEIETIWANVKLADGRQVGIGIDNRERTRIRQQLEEKNNDLIKLNGVLEDFVKIAAHDLRSPVQNLIDIDELISQSAPEDKISLIEMLGPVTRRLKQTIEGLMETVNLQVQQKAIVDKIRFVKIWKDVSAELSNQILNFNGEIETDFKHAPEIHFIEVHLISILRNLISNSLKYSATNKKPSVTISTKKENGFILLMVKDNGMGINLKEAGNDLFKPFKRFTSKVEGTGMGLYIVKNIVERNGGHVYVESEVNKGSTFYCYLKEYIT